jgi:hypothetical protein
MLTREALDHYRLFLLDQVAAAEIREKEGRGPGLRWAFNMGLKAGTLEEMLAMPEVDDGRAS